MGSIFPDSTPRTRYVLQGEAPFLWGSRLRLCYTPVNYTPTPTAGTSELDEHLGAHLAGIDAAIGAISGPGTYPDAWETADGADAFDTADLVAQWDIASV